MASIPENEAVGAVLVCGAGVAGIQAALDLAASGFKVYLLDSTAAIGGRMAQPEATLPGGDCAMCVLSPKLVECARNRNIEIITLADVQSVSGEPGNLKVRIRQNPRHIDIRKCEACGDCAEVCPVSLPAESGMRKAISRPSPQAIPNIFAITKASGQAPCKAHCPAGVNVPGFVALMAAGRFAEAYELLRQRCPLPASSGRVCRHPCESACNREEMDASVAISNLERFAADYVYENRSPFPPLAHSATASGRIAVVGGGPAGLTAAADLALMGYGVTLFEAKPELGGMLRYGIPEYRLPKEILDREIQSIVGLGIEVRTNSPIAGPRDLLKSGAKSNAGPVAAGNHDAVFVATGAWLNLKLGIPGEDARGVWKALEFLREINAGRAPQIGRNVLVIGGSDLSLDAARCVRRMPGVESVRLACIEARSEMPADGAQVAQAVEEGVVLCNGVGATRIEAEGGKVASVTFRACTSVYDSYRGYRRFNPLFDDSQISQLQADTVIIAAGRGVDASGFGVEMRPGGRILVDRDSLATSVRGIFAGGDVVLGPASVADAFAQGHKAAEAIDAYIRGTANIRTTDSSRGPDEISAEMNPVKYAPNPMPEAARRARVKMPRRPADGRCRDAGEISLGYGREEALSEARRCLSCGLCSECMQCVKVCGAGAIVHDQQAVEMEIEVGGIILAEEMAEVDRSGPGIHAMDAGWDPGDIAGSVIQGAAAAARAMAQLTTVRGTMIQRHEYPWERDVADEAPRIGVFVCHCGHNISSVIDVDRLARQAGRLQNVCHAETRDYTCSDASQQHIREMIRRHRLNRLVVASCSSRTHEVLFQETLRESGLNKYLLAMTDIRDQCSWVHRADPAAATTKAMDLVSMAVARARHLKQLPLYELPVTPAALIIGGGLAGMTAALNLAGQGFNVHLVEKESALGGMLRSPRSTAGRADAPIYLRQVVDRVRANPRITVHFKSGLLSTSGQVGSFTSVLSEDGKEISVEHGVVIVATEGAGRSTEKFLHGRDPRVMTQNRLAEILQGGKLLSAFANNPDPTIVMIQCVESRDAQHPSCSRVCCAEALENALEIKRQLPFSNVVIIGRDICAYGSREELCERALQQGVRFMRCPEGREPEVKGQSSRLEVRVRDASMGRDSVFTPDLLVLSTGISPAAENPALARILRSALTADGFFLEAHSRLRPVDLANEGEFVCGFALAPCFMDEAVAQAEAAAARASTFLSKSKLEIMGQIAFVNPAECVACATCVKICPYGAPAINALRKAEIQTAKCMGCGSCAAACPSRAVLLQHQEGEAMAAMFDELLVKGGSL